MKASLDCLECVVIQTLRAARIATDDPKIQREIVDAVVRQIPDMALDRSPAALSLPAYTEAMRISGNADPFGELRRQQNAMALELEPDLRKLVRTDDDPLVAALHLSAAGNIIDLGTQKSGEIDVHGAIRDAMDQRFGVDHSDAFKASLNRSNDLLFLLDNAGEIVFDKILIEELLKHTGVTAVVKGGPIINDAVMEDAEQVGLTDLCEVIDNGGAFIGSPPELVPEQFQERMRQADMIIGKGQGNYETIDDFPNDVFLILRAKCQIVADHMGVAYGQVALISTRQRRAEQKAGGEKPLTRGYSSSQCRDGSTSGASPSAR